MKALSTIIEEIEKEKNVNKQAELMKSYSCKALKDIIGFGMDPNVKWLLPEGDPPYRPLPVEADQEGKLYAETKMFQYFVDSNEGSGIRPMKREQLFIQLLESIDPRDALLVLRVKNKKLKINKKAVKMAFPGISQHW